MSMKFRIMRFLFLSVLTLSFSQAFGQEFIKSPGMIHFNRANYDSALIEINKWIVSHPGESDIAKYYLAESYYNIGMRESGLVQARNGFRQAHQFFQDVLNYSDLKTKYPKIYYSAQLKTGWCFFRRAETGERPADLLNVAYNSFLRLDSDAPDSLLLQSRFMAGESRYQGGLLVKYESIWPVPDPEKISQTISILRQAEDSFSKVMQIETAPELAKLSAEIRIQDVKYEMGKIYQAVPEEIFGQITDPAKKSSAREMTEDFFKLNMYPELLGEYGSDLRASFREFLVYSQAMVDLNRFFATFNPEDRLSALENLDALTSTSYDREIKFRQANADHNTSQLNGNDAFFDLYQNDERSFYFQAISASDPVGDAEMYFWLGSVQFIVNRETGIDNFQTFIRRSIETTEPRISALLENALYWRGVLFLEANRNDKSKLYDLKQLLQNFSPRDESLANKKDLLLKLTQLELGEDVRSDILQTRGLDKAVEMIQYLLRRASTVVGLDRIHYLTQLNRLFDVTRSEMANETNFYEGIAKSLEAEIQGDDDEKKNKFRESANILSRVGPPFNDEADYIRGRSLFFAERYDEGKNVLKKVVNEKRSLRSLFYFAEYLRVRGFGEAAKLCFESIKQKTQGNPDGRFWFQNAEAAINLCQNRADGSSELSGLRYKDVEFPEKLLGEQANSYEELADPKFLRFQRLQRSLELMQKFSMPKKKHYALANAPRTSLFKTGTLLSLPSFLNDMLLKETSSLELFVMYPEGSNVPVSVTLNGHELNQIDANRFKSDVLELGETVNLEVRHADSYLFKREFDIVTPGKQILSIPLTKKVNFMLSQQAGLPINHSSYADRLDKNWIIQNNPHQLPDMSELNTDLSNTLTLRDVTFFPPKNAYLVVDSKLTSGLRVYDSSGARAEEGDEIFELDFTKYDANHLLEPEGVSIDALGNLYITDFATHRVVIFNIVGKYVSHFGSFGTNSESQAGEPIKLMYPTRITIEQDTVGVPFTRANGESEMASRPTYILVADRNGIHRCDLQGHFLETIVSPDGSEIMKGGFYSLAVENYGSRAKLYIGIRETSEIKGYSAAPRQ